MKERYEGEAGARRLIDLIKSQRIVRGDSVIASALVEAGEVIFPEMGATLINQGDATNDVFFIVGGSVAFSVNGRSLGRRTAGRTVGEMSAINPAIPRSATVTAAENAVLLRVTETALSEIAEAHPAIWRHFAIDLAERLEERKATIRPCNERPKVFVICSTEALPIAQAIQFAFQYEEADFTIWSDEVFRASQYPIEALEQVLEESDFAIAIASPDDLVSVRNSQVMQPRDNVLVELGMSIGKLGRLRSMILVPRGEDVKLPSDFKGLTPITYQDGDPSKLSQLIGPACHQIRTTIRDHKVRTDR